MTMPNSLDPAPGGNDALIRISGQAMRELEGLFPDQSPTPYGSVHTGLIRPQARPGSGRTGP
jgi:hypothetical protein